MKKRNFIIFIFLTFFIVLFEERAWLMPQENSKEQNSSLEIADILQNKYATIKEIKADFVQETYQPGQKQPIRAKGSVYFKRNERMRWDYIEPEKQLIVTVRESVYLYEEEPKQVIVYPKNKFFSSEITRIFFIGKGELSKHFVISPPDQDEYDQRFSKHMTIKLVPKKERDDSGIKYLVLSLEEKANFVKSIMIVDKLDVKTNIFFENISINNGINDDLFDFIPPNDVTFFYYQ